MEGTGVVSRRLSELRSAEAGRAEANTRTAPAAMVRSPPRRSGSDARGGVGAVLMMAPYFREQLAGRAALARGRLPG